MRRVTESEVMELADEFMIELDGAEAEAVTSNVNSYLESLDLVDQIPVGGTDGAWENRSWADPSSNPDNSIAVTCSVPGNGSKSRDLDGVTVGVKDIIMVAGVPMQCSSALMRGFIPGVDATVVSRLLAHGADITAMTNADEFAASGRGTTNYTGPIRNPHDPNRVAGGSSGGSGVAVANETVDVALGTDTGGSIRIPAGLCGVVGLKPTYGLVPLSGVVENTYTQDHVGPLTRSVRDAGRVLEAIAGKDRHDPASLQAAGRDEYQVGGYAEAVASPSSAEDISIGVLENGFAGDTTAQVSSKTRATIDRLEDEGVDVEEVSIAYYPHGRAVKDALSLTEVASHWRAGGAPIRRGGIVDEGYQASLANRRQASGELGENYKSKILAGAQLIEGHQNRIYTRAQAAREVIRDEFDELFTMVDAVALPTLPDVAPLIEEAADPGFGYGQNTRIADVTKLPAISLPNGSVADLPVGFQLIGPAFGEAGLLGIAATVESVIDAGESG